jgi:hypothetical protein
MDGAFVERHGRRRVVDLGDHVLAAAGDVDHREVAFGDRAQGHAVGRWRGDQCQRGLAMDDALLGE